MNNWTWSERLNRKHPSPQRGHGSFTPKDAEPSTDFVVDEQSGLFLPGGTAKQRRKVEIGFHPRKDSE